MKKYISLLLLIIFSLPVLADKYKLNAEAPLTVAKGDQFRLSYTINTTDKVKDFRAATDFDGFRVLIGPSRSQSSSTQIINGNVTSSSSITFTYILVAEKEGTFTIPAASITVDGEKIISNSLKIKVLPSDTQKSSSSKTSQTDKVTDDQIFVVAKVDKSNVYEQEAILLTYKLYTIVDLRGFENVKLPDFNGFNSQEIDLPQVKQYSLEHYNGRNYNTIILRQYLLFPQRSGLIEIEPARFDASIMKAVATNDPFDSFFGNNYVALTKSLKTRSIKINVKNLPLPKPDNFIGLVGSVKASSSINKEELDANDAVTLKLEISGTGNLKLTDAPNFEFPSDFEVYDPKINDNLTISTNGMSGKKEFEYLIIPRHAGHFTIPSITFSYFDLNSKSYKNLATKDFTITVNKGSDNNSNSNLVSYNKEEVKVLANDIRYIHLGETKYLDYDKFIVSSIWYVMFYVLLLLIFIAFFIIYKNKAKESLDIAKSRNKRANKIATKRMKSAAILLKNHDYDPFYDEVLRTLWGYIADKLNIDNSELNKDNIKDMMGAAGLSENIINDFINLLNECEFARYAPGNKDENIDRIFKSAINVISVIENSIKK